MQLYAPLWAPNGGIYSLAQGVVYWSPPRSCVTAVREAVTEDDDPLDLVLHTYGPAQGVPAFRTALYEKLWSEHRMAATNHDVTVTAGANQAYMNIVLTVMGGTTDTTTITTDKAIVFAPYYFNHVMALQMCCGKEAVLVGPTNMDTGYPDITWLAQTLHEYNTPPPETRPLSGSTNSRVRMVTLVNPGNPTGMALSSAYVRKVVALCKQYNCWCVLDCTYEHFLNSPDIVPHLPTFPNEEHVLHIFSFSKGYSLAGYRCGYIVSCNNQNPNPNNKNVSPSSSSSFLPNMLKVQDTIPICPSRISQHVALGALQMRDEEDDAPTSSATLSSSSSSYNSSSKDWVYKKYATLTASRQYIREALAVLPQILGGTGSMYMMGKLPDTLRLKLDATTTTMTENDNNKNEEQDNDEPIDVTFCRLLIRDYGVAIIPGSFCGLPGWIRVCYANLSPSQTKLAAARLKKGITELIHSEIHSA